MNVFINQNVKIRYGGRKAPKMSIQDLSNLILNKIINDKNHKDYLNVDFSDPHWITEYIREWKISAKNSYNNIAEDIRNYLVWGGGKNTKLERDLDKYDCDWENCEINSWGLTPSGIPYIEWWRGGDWEQPTCVYFYYDGKNFRGYIPERGNCVNLLAKAAFGNYMGDNILSAASSEEDMYDISKYSKSELDEFKKSDFYFLMSELFPNEPNKLLPTEKNWDIFEANIEDLEIDWDKCREDFFARLEAI